MSDTNAQEPTMEEILASIRRIISEDDAPAAASPEADAGEADAPADEPAPAPVAAAPAPVEIAAVDEDDDILELTDPEPPAQAAPASPPPFAETMGDIEVFPRAAPPPRAPEPEPAPFNAFAADNAFDEADDGLISPPAASQAASAFSQLSRTVSMPSEGRTLEDVVREMLRPMLKDWLDNNLSSIVETAVQAEVERISRRRF
jgi:cell pole-organizing protein PopZ